jgi:hypothetical protein
MRVNYRSILNLEKVGFHYLGNLVRNCFITLAPGVIFKTFHFLCNLRMSPVS